MLTVSKLSDMNVTLDEVLCDGQVFGFLSGKRIPDSGTSQSSALLQAGS